MRASASLHDSDMALIFAALVPAPIRTAKSRYSGALPAAEIARILRANPAPRSLEIASSPGSSGDFQLGVSKDGQVRSPEVLFRSFAETHPVGVLRRTRGMDNETNTVPAA